MVLPDNIRPENSLYATGARVISVLKNKKVLSLNDLYEELCKTQSMSFNLFMLSLDWLFLINAINDKEEGIGLCI